MAYRPTHCRIWAGSFGKGLNCIIGYAALGNWNLLVILSSQYDRASQQVPIRPIWRNSILVNCGSILKIISTITKKCYATHDDACRWQFQSAQVHNVRHLGKKSRHRSKTPWIIVETDTSRLTSQTRIHQPLSISAQYSHHAVKTASHELLFPPPSHIMVKFWCKLHLEANERIKSPQYPLTTDCMIVSELQTSIIHNHCSIYESY